MIMFMYTIYFDFLFGTKLYLSNVVTMLVEPTKFHYGISCVLALKIYMKKKMMHCYLLNSLFYGCNLGLIHV